MSQPNDLKIPNHSPHSRVERALALTPMDGSWHLLLTMGMSSAEQTARAYNVPGASWELGYRHQPDNGEIKSELWAHWVG